MKDGDGQAESEFFDALYNELRRIARHLMAFERRGQTMTPTGLVHEAYLRLREVDPEAFQDHRHFLRLASKVMRQLVVDEARAYRAIKRPGGKQRVELRDSLLVSERDADLILAVHDLMDRLHQISPSRHDVVELHYFAGYTFEEIGDILGISDRTAKRHWSIARAWMRGEIDGDFRSEAV
jgi:RNA polymerase sigma-70 factor (ECF subfamily)